MKRAAGGKGGGVGRLERGGVVRHAVTLRAVVAHIDPVHHRAQECRGDIRDLDVVDPHDLAIRPGQIKADMAEDRGGAPGHVDALPRAEVPMIACTVSTLP